MNTPFSRATQIRPVTVLFCIDECDHRTWQRSRAKVCSAQAGASIQDRSRALRSARRPCSVNVTEGTAPAALAMLDGIRSTNPYAISPAIWRKAVSGPIFHCFSLSDTRKQPPVCSLTSKSSRMVHPESAHSVDGRCRALARLRASSSAAKAISASVSAGC